MGQTSYTESILRQFGMADSKSVRSPVNPSIKLSKATDESTFFDSEVSSCYEIKRESPQMILIHEDNQSAISPSKNPQYHGRSKHNIDIRYHYIRDQVKDGIINVQHCKTDDMIADMMTKGLHGDQLEKLRKMAGVMEIN